MGRWIWEKLQQWLILIIGLAVLAGSIGIGALFQSNPEPSKSIEVASVKHDDTPKPSAAPPMVTPNAATASSEANQAAARTSAKAAAKEDAKTDGKESSDTKAKAAGAAASAPQPVQTAAPMRHDHAPPPTTAAAASQTALAGDAAAGQQVFRKCQACHALEPGKNGLGPSLAGIVGEKAAAVPGYNFSPAMKASSLVWDAATLDAYLTDPQKAVPGNKMPFPGLKTERERSAVIAFLAANSKPGSAPTAATPARASPPAQITAPAQTAPTTPSDSVQAGANYVPGL